MEFHKTVLNLPVPQVGTIWGASPLRTTVCRLPGRGLFFPRITRPWNFGPHFGDFRIFWIQKRRGISPEAGYTNFQPVMFDMDPFGGKKVPCSKMPQKLEKLNNPLCGLLRPPGVLNNSPLFYSLLQLRTTIAKHTTFFNDGKLSASSYPHPA